MTSLTLLLLRLNVLVLPPRTCRCHSFRDRPLGTLQRHQSSINCGRVAAEAGPFIVVHRFRDPPERNPAHAGLRREGRSATKDDHHRFFTFYCTAIVRLPTLLPSLPKQVSGPSRLSFNTCCSVGPEPFNCRRGYDNFIDPQRWADRDPEACKDRLGLLPEAKEHLPQIRKTDILVFPNKKGKGLMLSRDTFVSFDQIGLTEVAHISSAWISRPCFRRQRSRAACPQAGLRIPTETVPPKRCSRRIFARV